MKASPSILHRVVIPTGAKRSGGIRGLPARRTSLAVSCFHETKKAVLNQAVVLLESRGMTVPVYSSHTSALSLFQSALHEVLSQQPEQQDSTHRGIGTTALTPQMMAASQVAKHFDHTGNFDVPAPAESPRAEAVAAAAAEWHAVAAPAAPSSVASAMRQPRGPDCVLFRDRSCESRYPAPGIYRGHVRSGYG